MIIKENKKTEADKNSYVLSMAKKKVFKNPEMRLLVKIFTSKKSVSRKDLILTEQRLLKKLLRKPMKPIKIKKDEIILTEMGLDLAEGFLEALLHLEKIS